MKEYLGDAVYVEVSEFNEVVLTTENGIHATNMIVLDHAVLEAFVEWLERLSKTKEAGN